MIFIKNKYVYFLKYIYKFYIDVKYYILNFKICITKKIWYKELSIRSYQNDIKINQYISNYRYN